MHEMVITFPGGARVDAAFGPYMVRTDQPIEGGGASSAPTPFATFLASIGTCAGIYVLGFCRQRGLPTDGIKLVQRIEMDPITHLIGKITLDIHVPPDFSGALSRRVDPLGRAVCGQEAPGEAAEVCGQHDCALKRPGR